MAWLLLGLLFVLIFLARLFLSKKGPKETKYEYKRRETLMTPAEQAFWDVLIEALPPGVVACPKVRMIDVVAPADSRRIAAMNKVVAKHLDFVLIDNRSTRIIAAIELDDASHQRPKRVQRDEFVDEAMSGAGVALIRWRAAGRYEVADLAQSLQGVMMIQREAALMSGSRI